MKVAALACVVLHNICIDASDNLPPWLDLVDDPLTHERRCRKKIRKLLKMRNCSKKKDTSRLAGAIRVLHINYGRRKRDML